MKIVLVFAAVVSLVVGQYGFQRRMWEGIPYVYHSEVSLNLKKIKCNLERKVAQYTANQKG